mgnify:CR=1 FL=1
MSVVKRRVTQIASNLSPVDFNPYKIVFLFLSGLGIVRSQKLVHLKEVYNANIEY